MRTVSSGASCGSGSEAAGTAAEDIGTGRGVAAVAAVLGLGARVRMECSVPGGSRRRGGEVAGRLLVGAVRATDTEWTKWPRGGGGLTAGHMAGFQRRRGACASCRHCPAATGRARLGGPADDSVGAEVRLDEAWLAHWLAPSPPPGTRSRPRAPLPRTRRLQGRALRRPQAFRQTPGAEAALPLASQIRPRRMAIDSSHTPRRAALLAGAHRAPPPPPAASGSQIPRAPLPDRSADGLHGSTAPRLAAASVPTSALPAFRGRAP